MSIRWLILPIVLVGWLFLVCGCPVFSTGSLHVLVANEQGEPLAGAKVISSTQPEGQMKVTGGTDAEGSVIYNNIVTGKYYFYVSRFDYNNQTFEVTVKAGRTIDVTIRLKKTSPGTGQAG